MSLESWKEEFYPKNTCDTTPEEAIEHSLQKWIGLRPENLQKHQLTKDINESDNHRLYDECNSRFLVDSTTCALCFHYQKFYLDLQCSECPLSKIRNGFPCCEPTPKEKEIRDGLDPYLYFVKSGDPEPMIQLLESALERKREHEP